MRSYDLLWWPGKDRASLHVCSSFGLAGSGIPVNQRAECGLHRGLSSLAYDNIEQIPLCEDCKAIVRQTPHMLVGLKPSWAHYAGRQFSCPHTPEVGLRYLSQEEEIVWLEDPSRFSFVREWIWCYFGRRRAFNVGKYMRSHIDLVGYSILRSDAVSYTPGNFVRRYWILKRGDRANVEAGVRENWCPCEGVDPLTIVPGFPGQRTPRCTGATSGGCTTADQVREYMSGLHDELAI